MIRPIGCSVDYSNFHRHKDISYFSEQFKHWTFSKEHLVQGDKETLKKSKEAMMTFDKEFFRLFKDGGSLNDRATHQCVDLSNK